jgi:hypothetical protein
MKNLRCVELFITVIPSLVTVAAAYPVYIISSVTDSYRSVLSSLFVRASKIFWISENEAVGLGSVDKFWIDCSVMGYGTRIWGSPFCCCSYRDHNINPAPNVLRTSV